MSNHNKRANRRFGFWVVGLLISSSLHAGIPVWTYSAPNPANVTITDGGTATVQYTVTNQSHKAKNLILQSTPGLSASACHLAGKGSMCKVTLTINGSRIPKQGIHSGPFLCEQSNPNQCYQPGPANLLSVVKGTADATLSLNPTTLALTEGGLAQTVTVTNTSATAVENLRATILGTSAITVDSGTTTCTSSLPANSSCQYGFLPGNQAETGTQIMIFGSNTASSVAITANVSEVIINLSPSTLSFAVGSSGSITVNNTSATTAVQNLQVSIPVSSAITVSNTSTCTVGGSIAALGSCTLAFTTPTNAPSEASTSITISGDNSNAPAASVTTTSTTLSVTSPVAIQTLAADGVATLSITVENTGATDANNVQISSPWLDVTFNPSSCGTIAPGAGNACTFTIQTNTPNIAGQITIQGDNTNTVTTPYIAFSLSGYLVFSTTGASPGTAHVIALSDNSIGIPWDSSTACASPTFNCTMTGATSFTDGLDNTSTIVTTLSGQPGVTPSNYAAGLCNGITTDNTGGVPAGTWYLPAICELGNFVSGCNETNIFSNLFALGFGGFGSDQPYWSSTEYMAISVRIQNFSGSGSSQLSNGKEFNFYVRCVRAITY